MYFFHFASAPAGWFASAPAGRASTVPAVLAQGEAAGSLAGLIPLILIAALFYFVLIRPQQKRARAQRELVASVAVNDRVVTVGGFHGTVKTVDEDTIRLELEPGTVVTMSKQAVARRLITSDAAADE